MSPRSVLWVLTLCASLNALDFPPLNHYDQLRVRDSTQRITNIDAINRSWLYSENCHSRTVNTCQIDSFAASLLRRDPSARLFLRDQRRCDSRIRIGLHVRSRNMVVSGVDETGGGNPEIESGDTIIRIDETPVRPENIDSVSSWLQARNKCDATFELSRKGFGNLSVNIERKSIEISTDPVVSFPLKGIAYARIAAFTPHAIAYLVDTLQHSRNSTGVVVDLRGNRGGYLDAVVLFSSYFLAPCSRIVKLAGNACSAERVHRSTLSSKFTRSVILLIDSATSNGAEIFAASLKDNGRALLLGDTTSGQNTICGAFALSNSLHVSISTAEAYRINGISIRNRVAPHVTVSPYSGSGPAEDSILGLSLRIIQDRDRYRRLLREGKDKP
jgi:carboxyl-terminal processing protease